jgi:hypothetical protein
VCEPHERELILRYFQNVTRLFRDNRFGLLTEISGDVLMAESLGHWDELLIVGGSPTIMGEIS